MNLSEFYVVSVILRTSMKIFLYSQNKYDNMSLLSGQVWSPEPPMLSGSFTRSLAGVTAIGVVDGAVQNGHHVFQLGEGGSVCRVGGEVDMLRRLEWVGEWVSE